MLGMHEAFTSANNPKGKADSAVFPTSLPAPHQIHSIMNPSVGRTGFRVLMLEGSSVGLPSI